MNTARMLLFAVLLVSQVPSPVARATGHSWAKQLSLELDVLEGALDSPDTAAGEEDWYLRNFWLRLRGQIGFEVPEFAKVVLVPEIEVLLQREFPEGWGSYKP